MASHDPIYRYLTDDGLPGDGTNQLANVDGSSTVKPFYAGPTERLWAISRLFVTIKDSGNLAADNYGAATELTNGVSVKIMAGHPITGTVVYDLLDGLDIVNNVGWAGVCYDITDHTFGAGDNFLTARWTFSKAGRPLILDSFRNEKLVVTINDNCTVLTGHSFMIQGHSTDTIGEHLNSWGS